MGLPGYRPTNLDYRVGLGGELIAVSTKSTKAHLFKIVSEESNNIVNHIAGLFRVPTMSEIVVSCNDSAVRLYDVEGLSLRQQINLDYSPNVNVPFTASMLSALFHRRLAA